MQKLQFAFWTTAKDLNQNFLKAQYAVRGLVPQQAGLIQERMAKGEKFPFDAITELNIGNPHLFGQQPITFNRQVLSTLLDPSSIETRSKDVQRRALHYLNSIGYGVGAYSASAGYPVVREAIASFIQRRDKSQKKQSLNNILVTDGASQGITLMFQTLLKDQNDGVMIPIPQYPLYSAVIQQQGAHIVPYYLEESTGWQVTLEELENQHKQALKKGINNKIIVAINPGNPTGQVFDKQTVIDIIKFAEKHKLIIFADEVYQENIYNPKKKFISFKSVSEELNSSVEMYSFHSISKGITGECGLRGGYFEIANPIDPEIHAQIHKNKTIMLCSNTMGQIMAALMVSPPTEASQETQDVYNKECRSLFTSLQKRATIVTDFLNSTKGVSCQPIDGAMYAFPTIQLSDKFIKYAQSQGRVPDEFYSLQLLQDTGLVVVPGSGFLQRDGTHHFRMTILILPEERLLEKMRVFKNWHEKLMSQY